MTTEISELLLAQFQCMQSGTYYGIRIDQPVRIHDYALYKKSPVDWRLSADVTVHHIMVDSDRFKALNENANNLRMGNDEAIKKSRLKLSRIDIIGQNGNTGEHYALDRDQVVAAISENLSVTGKAGLPYVLDAMQSAGLTVAVAAATVMGD